MKPFSFCLLAAAALLPSAAKCATPFDGRWDLVVTPKAAGVKIYPDWMEVGVKDGAPAVRIQPRSGSAFYAKEFKDGRYSSQRAVGQRHNHVGSRREGRQTCRQRKARRQTVRRSRRRARARCSNANPPKEWTAPEPIFNGKDLTGWEPTDPAAANHYVAKDGELLNESKGANLKTTRKFDDFKLHIEYNCPDEGNSGIYLRGRYEVQVEYEKVDANDKFHSIGAVYSMLAPAVELPRKPGTWESFDITLVGRWLTVVRNGVKTIDNQEIAGITGGALDSNEGEPGPFYIQGDHTGGMKYRNITIQVPKK